MKHRPLIGPVAISLCLAAAARLSAQAPPDISDLPAKSPISQQDQERLNQWAVSRVADFESSVDDANRMDALLRETLALLDRPTPEFLDAFGSAMSEASAGRLAEADPRATRYLSKILESTNSESTIDGLLAGLASSDPQTRWHSAVGLEARVAQAGVVQGRVVTAAETRIAAEPHPVVRRYLYRIVFAVNDNTDRMNRVTNAMNAAIPRIETAAPSALTAEVTALRQLSEPTSGLREADQRLRVPLARALAAILAASVERYTDPNRDPEDLKNLELLVMLTEASLRSAAREAAGNDEPNVSKAMFDGGASQAANMKAALVKWIGDSSAPGVLNADPWNLPVGGESGTTSAPASASTN